MRVIRINTGIATLIAVKAVYELIAQRPRVIYAGGLDPGKGADTGIRLAARLPECDFHIYGGNEDQIASLATQAPDNVGFHGHVDHATIMARLADHDIALAPYATSVKGEGADLRNAMRENGFQRAQACTVETIRNRWLEVLSCAHHRCER